MATVTFNAIQTLHVVAAMVVVGYLAVIPMWRTALKKDAEPSVVRAFLETVQRVQMRVVVPSLALLLLTGLLMVVGPFRDARYMLATNRMVQAGLVITLILGFIVWSGLAQPAKKMATLVEKGEHVGPAMDKLWGEFRTALLSAAVLSVVATGLMVFQAVN